MKFETLEFELVNSVGLLTIHRPKALNALNRQVMDELSQFLDHAEAMSELRCLIITGSGEKAFVAGADIKEMEDFGAEQALQMAQRGQRVFSRIENLKVPVIAAVSGFALGGGLELAMSCDFIIASEKAKVGLPEVSLGLIPGYGGTQRLSRIVGKATARRVALTGDIYSAQQAFDWGLVTELCAAEDLIERAKKVAQNIAARSPKAVHEAKKAINQGYDLSLQEGLELEAKIFSEMFTTEDKEEGVAAFIEKRSPKFTGR